MAAAIGEALVVIDDRGAISDKEMVLEAIVMAIGDTTGKDSRIEKRGRTTYIIIKQDDN